MLFCPLEYFKEILIIATQSYLIVTSPKVREQMYIESLQHIIDKYYPSGSVIPLATLDMLDEIDEHTRIITHELLGAKEQYLTEWERQKEYVDVLEELTRMKSDFVSSVSHELRTPLASIIGFAETMLITPDIPETTEREFLGIILHESQRLAKLINDLLDISRIEHKRLEIEKKLTDIVPVMSHVVSLVATEAANKSITLTSTAEQARLIARFDPDRMTQILLNLLNNAVKFTPDGGRVAITARIVDDILELSVTDNGLGIPAADMQSIFKKFFRVSRPRTQIRGTGLGLAIVQQLVELHGGTIDVQSEEAKGSTFTVRFPV